MTENPHREEWNGKLTPRGEHLEFFSLPTHLTDKEIREREMPEER